MEHPHPLQLFPVSYRIQESAHSKPSRPEASPPSLGAAVSNIIVLAQSPGYPSYKVLPSLRKNTVVCVFLKPSPLSCCCVKGMEWDGKGSHTCWVPSSLLPSFLPPSQPPALPKGGPMAVLFEIPRLGFLSILSIGKGDLSEGPRLFLELPELGCLWEYGRKEHLQLVLGTGLPPPCLFYFLGKFLSQALHSRV